eukprot:TRINITY_DN1768_c0_g1_i1.p1 TRINITY_DN1768_c0_g1~~TRINITY_DN1768_c0_g1_i1.p1  ORF type:complete len:203 (-),score=33.70 TRINITY_DN1768_c0_g1_i1:28-636(-)
MSPTWTLPRALFSLVLVATVIPASLGIRWSSCGPKHVPVTVLNVTMVPDPAVAGEDMTFVLPAKSGESLAGGWVYVSVFFHGVPVHLERDNLCVKTPCPVPAGIFTFTNAQGLPDVTPAGHYMLRLLATDLRRKVLFCARVEFEIVKNDGRVEVGEYADRIELARMSESVAALMAKWEGGEVGTPEKEKELFSWTHPAFQKN